MTPDSPPRAESSSAGSILVPFVASTLAQSVLLQAIDRPLRTEAAPLGIVSFELAGDLPAARRILASWDERARRQAAISLSLDYVYLASYSSAIALACLRIAGKLAGTRPGWTRLGVRLAYAQWLAALLDATENAALIGLLRGGDSPLLPRLARWCAIPKFVLVGAGLSYVLLGAGLLLLGRCFSSGLDACG